METIALISQIIIALGIFNVWFLRTGKTTNWRGGTARNMKEEFEVYGLPSWFLYFIGGLKVLLAIALLAGIWYPALNQPAGLGMAVLMIGAIAMHLKVSDPFKKSLPAFTMLVLSLLVAFF